MRRLFILFLALLPMTAWAQTTTEVTPLPGEMWWGAVINKGYVQPFSDFDASDNYLAFQEPKSDEGPYDLSLASTGGFTVPLLLSNKGRYIWSDRPFAFSFKDGVLRIYSKDGKIEPVNAGKSLKDAYLAASATHFPFDGREPAELLFTKPQFNNWIESAVFGINQKNAEDYVDAIAASGFPCGVVTIDGGWQVYHGKRDFNPDTFPDATRLFDKIHGYGYKSMLWCSYFLSADSRPEYVSYKPTAQNILVRDKRNPHDAALVWWWNGISVTMDLTSPAIRRKFSDELNSFAKRFHIDGFKFDGGNPEYFRGQAAFSEDWMEAVDFSTAFNLVGEDFPYNEFRAGFKTGGLPIVLRLHDIGHSWKELKTIIPNIVLSGLCGYPYAFPDMIGGGLDSSFKPGKDFSHKLFIRSCQIQALMPVMQFSAAPWRVLTEEECEICKDFARLHTDFAPYIMELVHHASSTGEPIVRGMEYEFPGQGYEKVDGQFMLGDKYLVAPVMDEDDSKTVYLPAGKWRDDTGKIFKGPKVLNLTQVPISRLPYYERLDMPGKDIPAMAEARRMAILNSPNTIIPERFRSGRCYFVSTSGNDKNDGLSADKPIKTLEKVNSLDLVPGDAVLFRRGDVWRRLIPDGSAMVITRPGVTYSAYGTGPKPILDGSPCNGAREGHWDATDTPDVYVYSLAFKGDVGAVVLDGKDSAQKVFKLEDLKNDLYYVHLGDKLYLRSKKGNPSKRFSDIEFNVYGHGFRAVNNVTIDNIHIRHIGTHGIGSGTNESLIVTNCEIGWIGGSLQYYKDNKPVRFGNGVEIYGGCGRYDIRNCWVYQCYDAGITHQYSKTQTEACVMENVTYSQNLIEDCVYSIEYFLQDSDTVERMMRNISFRDNICLRSGYGWGRQRPDKETPAHIKSWTVNNPSENFIISDNIFCGATHAMLQINAGKESWMPELKNNILVNKPGDPGKTR